MRLVIILLTMGTLFIYGCETFSGFGKDMQKAGDWVEKTAERAKPN